MLDSANFRAYNEDELEREAHGKHRTAKVQSS
jgi:hypothetical protein